MTLRITQYGEPVLRDKGRTVEVFGDKLVTLANEMVEAMYAAEGIGLAAQQVGQALQFCVVDVRPPEGEQAPFFYRLDGKVPPLDLIMPMALANPSIEILDPTESSYEEGCLSFPDIRGDVFRPVAIRAKFQDVDGHPHELECDGLLARCILHEVDHLNGVLFIDRMKKKALKKIDARVQRLKKQTEERFSQ